MTVSRKLAEFAVTVNYRDIDKDLQEYLLVLLVDTLGAIGHGSTTEVGQLCLNVSRSSSSRPEAPVIGTDAVIDLRGAAFVNGTQAHAYELDDYTPPAKIHAGAVVIPALLSASRSASLSGEDFLSAMLAGYEVMTRVSIGANAGATRARGWHLTGLVGPFGAAAACARAFGLSVNQTMDALGIAASYGGGLFAFSEEGSMTKRIHAGKAAEAGLFASLLAREGVTGPTKIFEATDGGFLAAVSDASDVSAVTEGLGSTFAMSDTAIKPYPCCGSIHSTIDAVLDVVRSNPDLRAPENIESIELLNSSLVEQQCFFPFSASGEALEAQMHLGYCAAVAILDGEVFTPQFEPGRIASSDIASLMDRISFRRDDGIERIYPTAYPARVMFKTTDGRIIDHYVEGPTGSAVRPIGWEVEREKFLRITSGVWAAGQQEAILEAVKDLPLSPSVDRLLGSLDVGAMGDQ